MTRYLPWGLVALSCVLVAAGVLRRSARAARQVPAAPGFAAESAPESAPEPAPGPGRPGCPPPDDDVVLALAGGEDSWW